MNAATHVSLASRAAPSEWLSPISARAGRQSGSGDGEAADQSQIGADRRSPAAVTPSALQAENPDPFPPFPLSPTCPPWPRAGTAGSGAGDGCAVRLGVCGSASASGDQRPRPGEIEQRRPDGPTISDGRERRKTLGNGRHHGELIQPRKVVNACRCSWHGSTDDAGERAGQHGSRRSNRIRQLQLIDLAARPRRRSQRARVERRLTAVPVPVLAIG
jgi:hypothetical protein